jgi:Protein kinase domain
VAVGGEDVGGELPADAGSLLARFSAGSRVAGYRLEEQIGAGGMAVVFRAVDERLGRQVALKMLAPALAPDEAFRHRFIRESRAAATVDDPHIIPVHEAGESGGVLFIAMRYVPGGDVRSLLYREGPLPPGRAAAIISPVASALDAAHAAGLVHRDVKPANMLLDVRPGRPDHVYLSDFGLSKGARSSVGLTGSGQFLGTPNYTAPEQIEGKPVDGRTDQYALACAAFEMLAGQAPFQRDDATAVIWAHMSAPPPSLASLRPDLPAAVDEVFAQALAKAPAARYARCADFAEALRKALGLPPYYSGPAAPSVPDAAAADHPATEVAWPADVGAADTALPVPVEAAAGPGAGTADGAAPGVADEPVLTAMATVTTAPRSAERAPQHVRSGRPLRGALALAAAVTTAAVVTVVVLLNTRQPGSGTKPPPLSAAAAVAAAQPDRLTEDLLDTPFAASDVPGGTSASASQLSDSMTGVTVQGLATTVYTKFSGSADNIWVNYYVFDNRADAARYYTASAPGISGYHSTGQLAGAGIGDPTKCQTVRATVKPQWGWACLTLSGSVVSLSATESDTASGAGLDLALARDAVRQLRSVATGTARGPFPQPPGSLQPSGLLAQVHRPYASALVPAGLNSPVLSDFTNEGTGLLDHDRVRQGFSGSGAGYTGAEIAFYVFDSAQDAQKFFYVDWIPYEGGKPDVQTGNTVDPSGFTSSQQAECDTFTVAATRTGISECYAQWGDVVVEGLTSDTRTPGSASLNMALTLVRSGLLSIGPAIAS